MYGSGIAAAFIWRHRSSTYVFGHITDKRTPSRPLGEVKLRRARLVVRWVTTREARVLKAQLLPFDTIYYYYDCASTFCFLQTTLSHSSKFQLLLSSNSNEILDVNKIEFDCFESNICLTVNPYRDSHMI